MEPSGTIKEYKPTLRERAGYLLADYFRKAGANNWKANKLAQTVVGGPQSNLPGAMGVADLALMGATGGGNALMRAAAAAPGGLFAYQEAAKENNPFSVAATVWHGSPHKMAPTAKNPLGEFDPTKIGTGEGAQAYAYGHYLADAQGTAKEYAEKLSSAGLAKTTLAQNAGQIDDAIAAAANSVKGYQTLIASGGGGDIRRAQSMLALAQKKLADLQSIKAGTLNEAGHLYKVDLPDEAIARMLDWDAPLSQQAPAVREAIGKLPKRWVTGSGGERRFFDPSMSQRSGGGLLKDLELLRSGSSEQLLRSQGIPGVKYFDGVSRGAGQGTRNYVVFPGEENILTILERNGMTR